MAKPNFFQRVYQVVRMVPAGQIATYGQIAEIVSHRRAARTVGWALNGLPEGSDVPWQRVINARGEISLGERGNATAIQRALLEGHGVGLYTLIVAMQIAELAASLDKGPEILRLLYGWNAWQLFGEVVGKAATVFL